MKHQLIGPEYENEGNPAQLIRCPDCGQLEWWSMAELLDHGKCRARTSPCWCEQESEQDSNTPA